VRNKKRPGTIFLFPEYMSEPARFTFPEKVNDTIKSGKNAGQLKTKSTTNLYRSLMHQITKETGVSTIDELKKRHVKVNRAIIRMTAKKEGESDSLHKSRVRNFYSAIFYVMPEEYLASPNPYYKAFQKFKETPPE
jgi:hypothetical protein